jgi:hypothetical protein
MKQKVSLRHGDKVLYEGRISDIPVKHDAIIKRSIELFDDDDPCIIHQSYVIKEYVDHLLERFEQLGTTILKPSEFEDMNFLDCKVDEDLVLELLR